MRFRPSAKLRAFDKKVLAEWAGADKDLLGCGHASTTDRDADVMLLVLRNCAPLMFLDAKLLCAIDSDIGSIDAMDMGWDALWRLQRRGWILLRQDSIVGGALAITDLGGIVLRAMRVLLGELRLYACTDGGVHCAGRLPDSVTSPCSS